ncbi:hypothetical protein KsCSTR_15840 [Candidatus Kuenenia stuttgartiensis]|uniref:Uncharacterized protein n=1 Tax=Kuenenia stuttgartiensis TaxID=174633 RepID=Q1Q1Q5_KUEST|nr:hypothetical protein KsCSTR_15840 [Candidatus Kuenenia stuttgartiensis]CAJ73943.1 unknown protein [Candidatus Kuenenia stuttgartiensis]
MGTSRIKVLPKNLTHSPASPSAVAATTHGKVSGKMNKHTFLKEKSMSQYHIKNNNSVNTLFGVYTNGCLLLG